MAKVKTRAWLEELARRSSESEDLLKEYEQNLREQQTLPSEDVAAQTDSNDVG